LVKVNCIIVFNKNLDKVLMCRRKKNPYKGLSNFVGGKIEPGEEGLAAAYRELEEETGISDIKLKHMMDFVYHINSVLVEIYIGKLNEDVGLVEEVNELYWSGLDNNFFDMNLYAGEGNIGHMLEYVKMVKDEIFN